MLKGVNRQVLEVNRPDSRYFERVLFIVKPEFTSLGAAKLLKEAQALAEHGSPVPPRIRAKENKEKKLYAAIVLLSLALIAGVIALVLK